MQLPFIAILAVSLLQFALGAVWYSPLLFGNMWMKIHGADKLTKDALKKLQKKMGPFYGLQFFMTLITNSFLAFLIVNLPQFSLCTIIGLVWFAFIVPTQISTIIWGGDAMKWWAEKIAISAGFQLLGAVVAVSVFSVL